MTAELALFGLGSGGLLASGVLVLFSRSPLKAALYLIVGLCSSALLYISLSASFVAAMQILVYAGAIMVLFVFVIMLLNLGPGVERWSLAPSLTKMLGVGAVLGVAAVLTVRVAAPPADCPAPLCGVAGVGPGFGSVAAVGESLLTEHLFGFEAVSLLLLVAVVGAVVLGLRRL